MSFKVDYSDVILCNRALARIPEAPIPNLQAASLAGRECRRAYKPTVRSLLEMHDWGLATVRGTLSLAASNKHPGFRFAYEQPTDMAYAVAVEHPVDARSQHYGTHQPKNLFRAEGQRIYTNVENAVLVYTSLNITEDAFNEPLAMAIELHLASKICMPIRKDAQLANDLEAKANAHVNTAIATYRNQQNITYGHEDSETDRVRQQGEGGYHQSGFGSAADYLAYSGR